MITTRLLPLLGGIAFLAAAPAFAQTQTKPADTGAPNTVNAPVEHGSMSPPHPMYHSSRQAMRSGRADSSQDATVDQLNDQSYQAAQQGQAFNGASSDTASPSTGSTGMPNNSSSMSGSSANHGPGKM